MIGILPKILLLENISASAASVFTKANFEVESYSDTISKEQLILKISSATVLGIKNKTFLDNDILKAATNLEVVGFFCEKEPGQVDLDALAVMGIAVFEEPSLATRSVAELAISMVISLSRKLGDQNRMMHNHEWNKISSGCYEIRGKTLGTLGYGSTGSQISILAESMGMKVVFYDDVKALPLGNSKKMATMEAVFEESDFVVLNFPLQKGTTFTISTNEIKLMKKGSYLLDCSRMCYDKEDKRMPTLDHQALHDALKSGHLGGAHVDIFPDEPESRESQFKSILQNCPNTILTSHISGETEEAEHSTTTEVATKIIQYLKFGKTIGSLNFPQVQLFHDANSLEEVKKVNRILSVHENKPSFMDALHNILKGNIIIEEILKTKKAIGVCVIDIADVEDIEKFREKIDCLPWSIHTKILF